MSFYFCFILGDSSLADSAFKGPQQETILKFMTPQSKLANIFSNLYGYFFSYKSYLFLVLKCVLLKVHLLSLSGYKS